MKFYYYLFIVTVSLFYTTESQAQPSSVKNVAKSVFTLTTYKPDGTLLATSHGVFLNQNGEAISTLKPFIGAAKAVVTDTKGQQLQVTRLAGTNELYDVARFHVDGKTTPAPLASIPLKAGDQAWIVGYADKKPLVKAAPVKNVETFNESYHYYVFDIDTPEGFSSCPLVNDKGEVLALVQNNATSFGIHATDAHYPISLTLNGLSYTNAVIRQISIPLLMPTELQQAQLALLMASQSSDSIKYAAAISDFKTLFPTEPDAYEAQARNEARYGHYAEAESIMNDAINKVKNKDEAHYHFGRIIYDKILSQPTTDYPQWTLDKAFEEIEKAYAINPSPLYKHLQGQVLFSQTQYQPAYDIFMSLYNDSSYASPQLLYQAARCKQMLKAPIEETMALLDSAINTTDTLQFRSTAPYFLTRAEIYLQADSFRQATLDYTRYEYLMQGNVNDDFYYLRYQAEIKANMFQQALSDISRCVLLQPEEPLYYAEMAQLQLRVNMFELAAQSAERCTRIAPEYAGGYLLLGLAQVKLGEKEKGLANMQKAKELGSDQADAIIEKYK